MTDEPNELTDDELESESAEELPDREAMSVVSLPGEPIPTPAVEEWGADPIKQSEET